MDQFQFELVVHKTKIPLFTAEVDKLENKNTFRFEPWLQRYSDSGLITRIKVEDSKAKEGICNIFSRESDSRVSIVHQLVSPFVQLYKTWKKLKATVHFQLYNLTASTAGDLVFVGRTNFLLGCLCPRQMDVTWNFLASIEQFVETSALNVNVAVKEDCGLNTSSRV